MQLLQKVYPWAIPSANKFNNNTMIKPQLRENLGRNVLSPLIQQSLKFQTIRTLHKVHPLHCEQPPSKAAITIALLMFQHCWIQVFHSSTSLVSKTRFIYGADHFLSGKVIYLSSPVMNIWLNEFIRSLMERPWNEVESVQQFAAWRKYRILSSDTKDDAFAFNSQF